MYDKINFKDGETLKAEQLNHMEEGIYKNSTNASGVNQTITDFFSEMLRRLVPTFTVPFYTIKGNVAVIGDSTISGYPSYAKLSTYFSLASGYTLSDISTPGDTLKGQLNKWNALDATVRQNLNYVFCQIGLNDIDETAEDFRTYYKNLIAKIRQDAPNAMLILSTMLPCKERWKALFPNDWEAYLKRWQSANEDIKNGYYDCDRVAYLHTDALGLYGALRAEYDHGDHIHEKPEGGKIIVFSWLSVAFNNQID